jgi:hypothetical protein
VLLEALAVQIVNLTVAGLLMMSDELAP